MAGKIKKFKSEWPETRRDIRWIVKQSKGVWPYVLGFLAISLLSMLFSLASPVASKYVVDAAIDPNTGFRFSYALIMLGTTLVSIILTVISSIFSSYVGEKFCFSVRARLYDRVQRGKWLQISKYHSGDMLSRLTGDVEMVASNILSIVPNVIVAALQLAIILVIVLRTDPTLALIGLIAGPLGALLALLYRKPFSKYQRDLRESQSEYYTFFQESLSNLGVIKAFELEDRNNQRFAEIRKRRQITVMKSARLGALMSLTTRMVYSMAYVLAFSWCAYQLHNSPETYTYGTMTLFLSLVSQIQGSIGKLGGVIPNIYSTIVCARRVREITEQPSEDFEKIDSVPAQVGLHVKDVSFTYEDSLVLNNISFDVAPRTKVGIVGSSGAGKTTIIRMLLALVSPDCGELYYTEDGKQESPSAATRRFISYVPQGNTLMTGTVRENLLVGSPDASDEMLWNALELANAADFIRRDPRGLDLPIRERSGGLSAGQAQRICIARAILRERPVLILDEATSALDEATERRIFERLSQDVDKTCFIITHRSSMLRYCDSVLEVADDGTVCYRKLESTT